MSLGWEITDSNKVVYKSWMSAVIAFFEDPTLRFALSEFDMAGHYARDVTEEVRHRAQNSEDKSFWSPLSNLPGPESFKRALDESREIR
jgi:hypothetical protein